MSEEISTAYCRWLATLERGQTIDVEQAFAAGYRAGSQKGAIGNLLADITDRIVQFVTDRERLRTALHDKARAVGPLTIEEIDQVFRSMEKSP